MCSTSLFGAALIIMRAGVVLHTVLGGSIRTVVARTIISFWCGTIRPLRVRFLSGRLLGCSFSVLLILHRLFLHRLFLRWLFLLCRVLLC